MDFIKSQFPIFTHHPKLVYLDSAATSQKPQSVIDAMTDFYSHSYANVHRGLYPLSEQATAMYEESRRVVANFIGATSKEIVFTANATDGLNLAAHIAAQLLPAQPKILISEMEHHSNLLPWQQIAGKLEYLNLNPNFEIDLTNLPEFDLAALVLTSNVTGANISRDQIALLKQHNPAALIVLDASQTVGHFDMNVKELGADFLIFSGHKMYGPTGVGVMYGKYDLLEQGNPYKLGGGMIREVTKESATWAPVPERYEAGTPAIAEVIGLAAAVKFIEEVGIEQIRKHEQELSLYLQQELSSIPGLKLFHPSDTENHAGVFSFSIEGVHPHDIAQVLGDRGICSRAGHHCAQVLHKQALNVPASIRVSLGVYNSRVDVAKLKEGLTDIIAMFK